MLNRIYFAMEIEPFPSYSHSNCPEVVEFAEHMKGVGLNHLHVRRWAEVM